METSPQTPILSDDEFEQALTEIGRHQLPVNWLELWISNRLERVPAESRQQYLDELVRDDDTSGDIQ